jgi:phospholipid/cholesterol/gamma-HCH transport system substrate-binding protein
MKKELKREAKIGIIVIVAFAIFIWGLNYLKGINLLNPTNHFYASFNQIDGLVKSSPVMLDGYQVGLVREIEYQYDNPGHIVIDLDLNSKLKLPEGSKAIIKTEMVGTPKVVLKLGPQGGRMLQSGDTLIADRIPGIMDQLSNGILADVQKLVQRANSLISDIDGIVSNGSLNNSLTSIEKTSRELQQISSKLNRSMDKIPSILNNVDSLTAKFSDAGTKVNQIDIVSLNRTLNNIENLSVKLDSPDNSMGLLLNDKSLYLNLNKTAQSADSLLLDLKERPKRYVHFSLFGSKGSK